MQVLEGDPGRKWRRLARWGALACFLATVLPWDQGIGIVGSADQIWNIATSNRKAEHWTISVLCCFGLPLLMGAPVFLIIGNGALTHTHANHWVHRILLKTLCIGTLLTAYLAFCAHLPERTPKTEMSIAFGISGLSVCLLLGALCLLASRRVRNTPLFIFHMGMIPISAMVGAWSCFIYLAYMRMINRSPRSSEPHWPEFDTLLGILGSLALLIGWIKWWGAVKKACAVKPTTEPTSQLIVGAADASIGR